MKEWNAERFWKKQNIYAVGRYGCKDCVHNEPRLALSLGAGAHLNNLHLFLRLLLKTAGQIDHESQERNWERMADGKKKIWRAKAIWVKYGPREICQFKQETEKGKVTLPDMKQDFVYQNEIRLLSENVISR